MKKGFVIFMAVVLFLGCLHAGDKVELFGYFESQLMGTKLKDDFFLLNSNKLRLDLKSQLSGKITFAANVNFLTFHGKTEWNILEFLSPDMTANIPQEMEPFYVLPFSDRIYLDNAYLKIAFKHVDLTVGKQQISLGTGYVWNPVDVFNIKDVLDPTYEQPGHNAVRLDVPLGSAYTLTALYAPDDKWRDSAKLIRLKGRISHFDIALISIEKTWRFHDYTQFDFEKMNFTEMPEKRQLFGVSTAGELLGIGVWAEYAYNKMETSKNFYELVIGADYTFDFQTYIMAEFYRSTIGKADYKEYNINDWMRMLASEQKAIARDQIYGYIKHPATDFLDVGLSTIYSISDNSVALVPTFNYNLSENVDIMAYLNLNIGKEGTAFAANMGNGGLIRIRAYF